MTGQRAAMAQLGGVSPSTRPACATVTAGPTDRPARRILYLVHDLDDPAVWRRVEMLQRGGASVDLAGFRRGDGALPGPARVLGRTHNGRMVERAWAVLHRRLRPHPDLAQGARPDAILARNLETLALAVPLQHAFGPGPRVALAYEVLDIHRLLVGPRPVARLLRRVERWLARGVDLLLVSSPGFVRAYFDPYGQCAAPVALVENKVPPNYPPTGAAAVRPPTAPSRAIRIGCFGMLRCRRSLHLLDRLTKGAPGRYEVILRGRPAYDAVPEFHRIVAANPDLHFAGPYTYPDELPAIYGAVDLAWLVDCYEAGANSDWLLPNRFYESGVAGVPAVALAQTEVGRRLRALGIGLLLERADDACVAAALGGVSLAGLDPLRVAQRRLPVETWRATDEEARALVCAVAGPEPPEAPPVGGGLLIAIPALNEAEHIGSVLDSLMPMLERRAALGQVTRVVVADGGSHDGTAAIVRASIARHPGQDIRLMPNPARLQSAGVNAVLAAHGAGMGWLLRLDAHARYPADYAETLLDEARARGAGSVVVSMRAVGAGVVQRAIALAQNTPLGTGGAAHRAGRAGRYVEHGHHALMRMDAFRAMGGYDETFSHNEDAELDRRLIDAGQCIWLTARTGLDYIPRARLGALAWQYLRFGRGRARTLLKHGGGPAARQGAVIALAPLTALALLAPVSPVFAGPLLAWGAICLGGGAVLALSRREPLGLLAGPVAGVMHMAWSVGFWQQLLAHGVARLGTGGAGEGPAPADPPAREIVPDAPRRAQVAVGVCTYRRAVLTDTLATLEAQALPSGTALTIIVSDNDTTASARPRVAAFAARSRHRVLYQHAPASNISVARNAILDTVAREGIATLAFIDDDELAPPHWLAALLARLAAPDADAVIGPTRAIYPKDAPRWMTQLAVHDTRPEVGRDGRPIAGHTCNVILDLTCPAFQQRRFDPARGISGGEDTAYFAEAIRAGARLALAPMAQLEEPVPPARTRTTWLLRRRFRMGQTHGSLLRARGRTRVVALPLALSKVAYCAFLALVLVPFSAPRNANLLRGALHAGTASSLVGVPALTLYGAPGDGR